MARLWQLREVAPELELRWTEAGYWDDSTLGRMVADGLRDHPDQVVQIHSQLRPWHGTFADLDRLARRLAGGLRDRGIGPGDPVAFQLPNCMEAAVTFYAASLLGAVVVPIVHFYGPKEVGYILRRTGVRAFVTIARFGPTDYLAGLERMRTDLAAVPVVAVADLDRPLDGIIPLAYLIEADPVVEPVAVDPAEPALVAYTSGTTAEPKGVIHSHRTIGAELRQLRSLRAHDSTPVLIGAPVGHFMGMLGALLGTMLGGDPIHLVDVWEPGRLLALMLEYGLACGSGATFFLTSLLDHPDLTDEHLKLMHYLGMGGAAIPAAVAERATGLGLSIVRMYGSTEHPSITGASHDDPLDKRLHTDGHALPGTDIRLVDEHGADVATGEPGEILSRGPDCCMGYTDPALTAVAFDADGWFHTEDVGVLDADGYLRITDRKKDIIIRGGENVSAAEVEEIIAQLPEVAEVAVVAAPDPRYGERVSAVIRLAPGATDPGLDRLRDATAAAGLGRQKWPEELRVVDEFPRTPSGKIQKAVLRAADWPR